MEKIVLATRNKGKVRELSSLLARFNLEVIGLDSFPNIGEIEENGRSFAENALIKARTVARETGLLSVADDSGIEVEALSGAPGIYSARYGDDWDIKAGENRDWRNIRKLLANMKNEKNRACRFVTAIAAVRPDGREIVKTGYWNGQLLEEPRGGNGFGYDPVFFDQQLGKAAAELPEEVKNKYSHRSRALAKLLAEWEDFMKVEGK